MSEAASPLERVRSIEARRGRDAAAMTATCVAVALGLSGAFLVGHMAGPTPLRVVEVVLGISGMILIALGVARPLVRQHVNRRAKTRLLLKEGNYRRRVMLFPDYIWVEGEVILPETVETIRRQGDQLLLRYRDPVAAGPLLREWTGSGRALDQLADAMDAQR